MNEGCYPNFSIKVELFSMNQRLLINPTNKMSEHDHHDQVRTYLSHTLCSYTCKSPTANLFIQAPVIRHEADFSICIQFDL